MKFKANTSQISNISDVDILIQSITQIEEEGLERLLQRICQFNELLALPLFITHVNF